VLYGAGLGVSSIASALIIYPVALPGESPLKMKTGMMGSQMLSQLGSMMIAGLFATPVCLWGLSVRGGQAWLMCAAGFAWGFALIIGGVILGGIIMDARGPSILSSLIKNDSKERS
jgi:ABC-2 type transport system permease protein